jgi:DNA-binding transcriptional regulator YhcF (GntR family)
MSLGITLDRQSPLPIFFQIRHFIRHSVGASRLAPGARLPSVRELAAQLGVATNTVARAYRELQDEGIIVVSEGQGTYVADLAGRAGVEVLHSRLRELSDEAYALVAHARARGFTSTDIHSAIEHALASMHSTVIFIGTTERASVKYKAYLGEALADLPVEVRGATIDVLRDARRRAAVLDGVSTAVTLVSTFGEVSKLLEPVGANVVALLTEPTDDTHAALSAMPITGKVALVAEDVYLNSLLALLSAYCPISRIKSLALSEVILHPDELQDVAVVAYSFNAGEVVSPLLPPGTYGIELEYVPSPERLRSIRDRLAAEMEGTAARVGARKSA